MKVFTHTIYRVPTNEELSQFAKHPEMTANDILSELKYTIIGKGISNEKTKIQIQEAAQKLVDLFPGDEKYLEVKKLADAIQQRFKFIDPNPKDVQTIKSMLSENFKNRLQSLAGLAKPSLNEDMHPQFLECGFFDMANGNPEILLSLLDEAEIKYTYDENRNFITIETSNPRAVLPMLDEARITKINWKDAMAENLDNDPNDCVLLRLPAPNVPPGAMM